jgi:hypothetical protein
VYGYTQNTDLLGRGAPATSPSKHAVSSFAQSRDVVPHSQTYVLSSGLRHSTRPPSGHWRLNRPPKLHVPPGRILFASHHGVPLLSAGAVGVAFGSTCALLTCAGVDAAEGCPAERMCSSFAGVDAAEGCPVERMCSSFAGVDAAEGCPAERMCSSFAGVDAAEGCPAERMCSSFAGVDAAEGCPVERLYHALTMKYTATATTTIVVPTSALFVIPLP